MLRILQWFRKNKVFLADQSSPFTSVSTVISCTRVSTRSDHLMTGTAVHKAHHSTLHASCCADIDNDMYIEELDNNDDDITASIRVQESGVCRLRPNAARGRRNLKAILQ